MAATIVIPTYTVYKGCKFGASEEEKEEFLNFIKSNAFSGELSYKTYKGKNYYTNINFRWNIYQHDYPPIVEMTTNQWFLYEEDNLDNWKVLDEEEINKDWYIHYES